MNVCSKPNSFCVQKIDDYNARVHSDSVKTSRNDFLFCKSENSDGTFQYNICDLERTKKLYGFSSPVDITIADCETSNSKLGAGVWALASGAVDGILGGATAVGTAAVGATAVADAGATSAAAGIGWLAGAKVAGAVLLTAAGPGAILAGAGAIAGLG